MMRFKIFENFNEEKKSLSIDMMLVQYVNAARKAHLLTRIEDFRKAWHPPDNLTTITTGPGFLGNFVLLLLKTCSLYHEKLFIQVVNDISTQVFNNFFSASDTMEAVKGRFCFHKYECKQGCVIQVILLRSML